MRIITARKILEANDQAAAENRHQMTAASVLAVNLVGSPGCGKTTFLEGLFRELGGGVAAAVIEGDVAGQTDAERIAANGVPVVQINTAGMCHLEAHTVAEARRDFDLTHIDILFIENVGNLVCTASFDLGEHLRLAVLSVAEGDDKIAKYPAIFQRSDALLVTKTDLLPHCRFDAGRVRADMKRLASHAEVFEICALHGEGLADVARWLAAKRNTMTEGRRSFSQRAAEGGEE